MVKIPLLPEGTYIRDFADLFLVIVASHHKEYSASSSYIEFSDDVEELCSNFSAAIESVLREVNERNLRSIKIPRIDKAVFLKALTRLGIKELQNDYINTLVSILRVMRNGLESGKCKEIISDLSIFKRKGRNVFYGNDPLAPLQIFKLDKYEYAKDFLNLKVKGDVRLSPYWIGIVAGGWLLSYMGYKDGALLNSLPPSYFVENALYNKSRTGFLRIMYNVEDILDTYSSSGSLSAPLRLIATNKLPYAYQILLAFEVEKSVTSPEGFFIRLIRTSYDGIRFTIVEDSTINISFSLLEFVRKIKAYQSSADAIRRLAECSLQGYGKGLSNSCKRSFGDMDSIVKMINALYRAIVGSLRIEDAIYYLARLSPFPQKVFIPPFRNSRILDSIYKVSKE